MPTPLTRRKIVRCSKGALYSTIWLPFGSLKAVRLGRVRLQWCPVHRKFERIRKVDPSTLSKRELKRAVSTKDLPIP